MSNGKGQDECENIKGLIRYNVINQRREDNTMSK